MVASPATAGPVLPQNKIESLLLSDDDAGSIVGLPVHRIGGIYPSPGHTAPEDRGECQSLLSSDVELFSGDFTAFRQVAQQDNPDDLQFALKQFVATYPDSSVAARVFRHALSPNLVSRCGATTFPGSPGVEWHVLGLSINWSHATWKLAEFRDGQATTWQCASEVQVKGNVMFQDQECQYGNGSPVVAQMANLTASRIPS
jgi:hypothetical protein